jgi:hypothetical protein
VLVQLVEDELARRTLRSGSRHTVEHVDHEVKAIEVVMVPSSLSPRHLARG